MFSGVKARRLSAGLAGLVVALSSVFSVLLVPTDANAATFYGRDEYQGYFTGKYRKSGSSWPCNGGQLICNGIPNDVDTPDELISFYSGKLNGGSQQDQRGAAFAVLVMVGEPSSPVPGYAAGISRAKARFGDWAALVRAYHAADRLNFSTNYTYQTNTAYSGGINDVVWHYQRDDHGNGKIISQTDISIVFDIGEGRAVAIKRACANMVGDNATLPPPPNQYSLDPSITTNTSGAVEPGTSIGINPSVSNAGPTPSTDTSWRLSSFRVSSGNTVPSGGNSGSDPCSFYAGSSVSNCGSAAFDSGGDASGTFSFPVGTHNYTQRVATAPDIPAGTKFCYALSVNPRSHAANEWRHSVPTCVVIGSKPKVQVWGADLYVGRVFAGLSGTAPVSNIQTSTSTRNVGSVTRTWGSWGEYGAQANGAIRGFGTGAAFAAGSGLVGATACNTNPLTFTNGTNGACANNGTFGNYVANQTIPSVASSFPTAGATNLGGSPTITLSSLSGTYTATGTVRIDASTIGKGRTVVLNAPTATVLIRGNISYNNGTLNSISDIPQVLIIARNINIEADVDNVDAWLIARGTDTVTNGVINTCSNVAVTANLALSPCNNQLTVNGPVMANKLYLRRTTDSSSSAPAEIFNLRPDAFLWAYARSTSSARVQTVYTTELPPRL